MVDKRDVDRLFLQAVMSRGVLSTKLAKTLWKRSLAAIKAIDSDLVVIPTNPAAEKKAWEELVTRINNTLDKIDLQFRTVRDETTGVEMCALVNLKEDELSLVATDYSAGELTFFRAIVEQIMTAPRDSFCVSSTDALAQIAANKLSMTLTQGEVLLTSFVSRGWLRASTDRKGLYTLATRAILELSPYLRTHYEDELLTCRGCSEILTRGIACHNCNVKMHFRCFDLTTKASHKCSGCGTPWPDTPEPPLRILGEAAASTGGRRRSARGGNIPSDSEEEAEESMDEDTQEPTQTQRTRNGKKKARFQEPDSMYLDDEAEDEDVGRNDEPGPSQPRSQSTRRSRR